MNKKVGIIDLGSNTARLVIYQRYEQGQMYEVDNIKRVLRLSGHLQNGRFDASGIDKTLDCMRQFKAMLEARQVTETLGVATAAFRQAENGRELAERIESETGIRIEILSGDDEARYGYLAVMNSMSVDEGITVDIGGGSTEITYFANRQLKQCISLPIGIVSLTKMFLSCDPPQAEEIAQLNQFIQAQLAAHDWIRDKQCPVIAIGGTARNVAKIHQRQRGYSLGSVHHYALTPEQIGQIFETLSLLPYEERKQIPGISKDRADVILSGIAILQNLLAYANSTTLLISNKGLRDGVLYETASQQILAPSVPQVRSNSVDFFMTRYQVDKVHARHVANLAVALFDAFNRTDVIQWGEGERELLEAAASLHDVGRSINVYESSQHTFYLLSQVLLLGFTHRERLLIAMAAAYKNNKQLQAQLSKHKDIMLKADKETIEKLGHLVLLAKTLDRSMTQQVKELRLTKSNQGMLLQCVSKHKDLIEYTLLEDVLLKVAKVFKRPFSYQVLTHNTYE